MKKNQSNSKTILSMLRIIFFCFAFLIPSCSRMQTTKINAIKGVIDLQSVSFDQKSIYLDGEWEFYPSTFLNPTEKPNHTQYIRVPSSWNDEMKSSYGYASFRLKVLLPKDQKELLAFKIPEQGTSYRIFVNGVLLANNGTVGVNSSESKPEFFPIVTKGFVAEKEIDIILHISNFEHREGGFWYSILLGKEENIKQVREDALLLDLFLCGSILIMGAYHIGLFIIRKKDLSPLYFGLFCFVIIFRLLSQSEKYLVQIIPGISFRTLNQTEYISYFLALPSFSSFICSLFPKEFPRKILIAIWIIAFSFCGIVLFTSTNFYTSMVNYYHLFTLICIVLILYTFVKAWINKRESVLMLFIGTMLLIAGTVNDILHSIEVIHTSYIVPHSLLAFIFVQSIILSIRFSKAFYENEKLIDEMTQLSGIQKRFVPKEFLENLGKKNFSEVKLGDQIQKQMTILFSDIRDFTSLSEHMNPKENFQFINEYLSRMGPLVRKQNGFIDKFIGDAIMALFNSPDEAIQSAIDMQKELTSMNESLKRLGKKTIDVGIGIHTGSLMMGVIGEEERFEGTVISDAVNVASRIEGLTKYYHSKILVSEDVLLGLKEDFTFTTMKIDKVKVKGKSIEFAIYEILDGLNPKELDLVLQTKLAFETGVECYIQKELTEAKLLFEKVLSVYPSHSSAQIYLKRCVNQLNDEHSIDSQRLD